MNRQQALAILTAPGQDYELEPVLVNGHKRLWFSKGPTSFRQFFEQTASDKTFFVYEEERLTYRQAWEQASKIAQALVTDFGIGKGDRVAISMRNYPEWVIAFTAITSIGAVAVAMNALWQTEEMIYGLTDSGAKLLFADQERLDRLAQGAPVPGLQVVAVRAAQQAAGIRSWQSLLHSQAADCPMPAAQIALDDPAKILYTSGSTGHPKGVVTTHRNALSALLSWELDAKAGELVTGIALPQPLEQAATLLAVPLFHVTGLNAVYLSSYRPQRRIVSMYKWNPEQAAELIERERISSVVVPAAMSGDLVRTARQTRRDLSSLLSLGGGGAPRAAEQVRQIDQVFANAMPITGWGMTETCAIGTGIGGPDYLLRPNSSGRCSAVLELRIIDDAGKTLGVGEQGELLVRGTSVFGGYWNRPEANAQSFIDDWFRTGDVAYLDEEGFLFIVDRIKDIIIRGGENIGCGRVENVLLSHPDVHEASVYAVPDERLGEEVGATIHGPPGVDLQALRAYLEQHLAKFEVPRYLIRSDGPLPRTPSGKILRRQIRSEALRELQAPAPAPSWFTQAIASAPVRRMVDVDGVAIETLVWGETGKPGLLLMHGNFAHADWYSFIAPLLAAEYRVVAFSFSGMGGSAHRPAYSNAIWADEAMAVARATGMFEAASKPVFVGHSFGGFPLMNISARFGEQLRLAIIADTPLRTREQRDRRDEERPRRLKPHRVYATRDEALARFRLMPEQPCEHRFIVDHIARTSIGEVKAGERAGELEEGKSGWTWRFDPYLYRSFSMGKPGAELRAARCPIAWLNGARSSLVTDPIKENIRAYSPAGTPIVEIADADHHLMIDQPLAFVAELRKLMGT